MIPYDDLVVALASWRAKQGLPVGSASTPKSGPTMSAAPVAPAPPTGSGSGPKRGGPPPMAPPGSGRTTAPAAAIPAPLPLPAETLDVDDSLDLHEHLDEHHEVVDDDDADVSHTFGNPEPEEATSIGGAPRDSFGGHTDPNPLDKRNRNDW